MLDRLPPGPNQLERSVIERLLEGDAEERPILREQYKTIYLFERTWKPTGYWAKFSVDETLPRTTEYDDYDLEGVAANISGVRCDFTLSMFDGRIFLLYAETHDKCPWPNPAIIEKVYRSSPC